MDKKENYSKEKMDAKDALAYSFGNFADTTTSQFFSFLLFTFYFAVVGLNIFLINIVLIVWSVWNAVNDPIMGAISDKTNTKIGKRKPWIILGIIPTLILVVLLWTPPAGPDIAIFFYMMIVLLLLDTFYTMYSLNQVSLFPEMFQDLDVRAKANNIVQILGIIALLFAFLMPSVFIPTYDDPQYKINYFYAGIFMSSVSAIAALIFIKFGLKERVEFQKDSENAPSFVDSLLISIKNKSFRTYVVANTAIFYVFGMLTALAPIYGSIVLGIKQSFIVSLLLGIAFVSAAGFMVLWNKVSVKYGVRKGQIISMITFAFVLLPFLFVTDAIGGILCFILAGVGLAGALFFRAVTMGAIIDEDELNTGIRREGGYFGINALFVRLSTVAVSATTSVVFFLVDWTEYDPSRVTPLVIFGLRSLMVIFPAIALGLGIYSMTRFPITKERYFTVKEKIESLHEEKRKTGKSKPVTKS